VDHSSNPICLYDICSRVGGQFSGKTTNCVTINANNVIGDNPGCGVQIMAPALAGRQM